MDGAAFPAALCRAGRATDIKEQLFLVVSTGNAHTRFCLPVPPVGDPVPHTLYYRAGYDSPDLKWTQRSMYAKINTTLII